MTERRRRLERIFSVRQRQHTEALVQLGQAWTHWKVLEADVEYRTALLREADSNAASALSLGDQQEWLISSAGSEIAMIDLANARQRNEQFLRAVATAEEKEVEARRALRQMELLLEAVREEEALAAARKEQKRLDESSQVLKARSFNGVKWLGTFS